MYSEKPEERGVQFRGIIKVDCDGTVTDWNDHIRVENATTTTLYFSIETSYNGFDKFPAIEGKEYKNACLQYVEKAVQKGFEALLEDHVKDHQAYYDRVSFRLGSETETDVPTIDRLIASSGGEKELALYTLLFNFGRYLMIASSRAGSTATNLQGIWNKSVKPSWNSNYTVNINTEMNYWSELPCNMPEMMTPLVDFMKMLSKSGEQTAKDFYHANGFVVHHNADIWGYSAPVYGAAAYGFWPGASGWLCQNLYDIYAYTQDKEYLRKEILPIMKKAAEFYLDLLIEDEDQSLIICPSTSPENCYLVNGEHICVSRSTAMTNMIVKDLFLNCKEAYEDLGLQDEFYDRITSAAERIKPLMIGEDGSILEWNEPVIENEVHHRHTSHLYALYPASLITEETEKELFEACKQTLENRGDDGSGWSLAWKVCFWARLRDGNRALKLLDRQLRYKEAWENDHIAVDGGTFANMFDAHPPFQIDGNFGIVSGMCEMLLQSDRENIYLLPALPDNWKDGSVKGLAARGNVTVDMEWKDGKLTDYTIHGELGNRKVVVNPKIS